MKTTAIDEQTKAVGSSLHVVGGVYEVLDLGPFDNNRSGIQAINDLGQMAGVSINAATGRIEAFREEAGKRTSLGTLGGSFSIARDINNGGEIVGGSLTKGDDDFHGFLYRDDQIHDLNELLVPGSQWELIQALSINDRSEILGIGSRDGQDRMVLLRPSTPRT